MIILIYICLYFISCFLYFICDYFDLDFSSVGLIFYTLGFIFSKIFDFIDRKDFKD